MTALGFHHYGTPKTSMACGQGPIDCTKQNNLNRRFFIQDIHCPMFYSNIEAIDLLLKLAGGSIYLSKSFVTYKSLYLSTSFPLSWSSA